MSADDAREVVETTKPRLDNSLATGMLTDIGKDLERSLILVSRALADVEDNGTGADTEVHELAECLRRVDRTFRIMIENELSQVWEYFTTPDDPEWSERAGAVEVSP